MVVRGRFAGIMWEESGSRLPLEKKRSMETKAKARREASQHISERQKSLI